MILEPSLLAGLIALLFLLVLDAFFSATRAALTNARRHILRERAERGDARARRALAVAEDSTRVLSTFELAILLAHFLTSALFIGLLYERLPVLVDMVIPDAGLIVIAAAYALLIPLVGFAAYLLVELVPGALVQRDAEDWAVALAAPAEGIMRLFSPAARLVNGLRRWIAALGGGSVEGTLVTEEEIMTLVDAGEEEGAIEQEEKEMIYSIFQLDETLSREIMVPRIDMMALEVSTPLDQAIEAAIKAGHSRIPVYEESLDHVKGLLYAKDLLSISKRADRASLTLQSILRPAFYVPETKKVLDLLREMQTSKVHMAIVIDEYGGTSGLVTIEDIVEEVVGEIHDEYDKVEEALMQSAGENEYIFDARISLDDFNELLNVELPDDLADTLGGYIYGQLGKVPHSGETIETHQLRIEVTQVVDQRILKVRVTRLAAGESLDSHQDGNGNESDKNQH